MATKQEKTKFNPLKSPTFISPRYSSSPKISVFDIKRSDSDTKEIQTSLRSIFKFYVLESLGEKT